MIRIARHRVIAAACSIAIAASIAIACAGGDGGELEWEPEASNALLSPSNDTRANLILLMADRFGTRVADPGRMATGIVPFNTEYSVFESRLYPMAKRDSAAQSDGDSGYGLTADNRYFGYDSGKTGLCHTNRAGAAQFATAVAAEPLVTAAERSQLLAARASLASACDKAAELQFAIGTVASPAGIAFARYLEGSRLFYAEQLPAAAVTFGQIGPGAPDWVRDSASYMRLRALLAHAIKASVDEWGSVAEPAARDAAAAMAAASARRAYLTAFPNGRYVRSARDFERRIAWISGDTAALGQTYSRLVAVREKSGGLPAMSVIEEIDRKLLPSRDGVGVSDPMLLAVIDLMRLRQVDGDDQRRLCGPLLSRDELERQRPTFANQPELYNYLLATEAFTSRKQPREVLTLIPDASRQSRFSYLQFSRQMLRGFALEAVGDRNARGFWLSLLPGARKPYQAEAVQLAILKHDRAAGIVGRLLETGSPLVHPLMRSAIIEKDASIDLLRRMVTQGADNHERNAALYVLLGNELHFGMYRDFLADQRRLGTAKLDKENESAWSVDGYSPDWDGWPGNVPLAAFAEDRKFGDACPTLRATVSGLAADANAIGPLMCLAEFIRAEGFETWNMNYDPASGRYRTMPRPGFSGTPVTRAQIYHRVMNAPAATDDQKAFALNRAVRCYQPSGINDCGGDEVTLATRKAWFTRLKSEFPASRWAKDLKYYW